METTNENAAAQAAAPTDLHETEVATKDAAKEAGADVTNAGAAAVQAIQATGGANLGEALDHAHDVVTELKDALKAMEGLPGDIARWFKAKFDELHAKLESVGAKQQINTIEASSKVD
jgi:hypothetical protein